MPTAAALRTDSIVVRPKPKKWQTPAPASEELKRLLGPLGIKVLNVGDAGYFRPGHTKCGAVLTDLLDRHGPDHMVMLARTFVETRDNATAMREDPIQAVSDIMLAFPNWPQQGLRWLEQFDGISLLKLNEAAKPLRHRRHVIAGMLVERLRSVFEPQNEEPKVPVVPGLIEIGARLLRHAVLHPTWTDRQLAIDLKVYEGGGKASALMRAARIYGKRVDLIAHLSQKTLLTLVSPTLPEAVRLQAEEMLEDGKKLTGGVLERMARAVSTSAGPSAPPR